MSGVQIPYSPLETGSEKKRFQSSLKQQGKENIMMQTFKFLKSAEVSEGKKL